MKGDIKLKYKKKIYFSVFLPIISYGSEIWLDEIKKKKTYKKKLDKLQRSIILAVTGAYKTTNNIKLLKLIKINCICEEIEIKQRVKNVENKREEKLKLRMCYLDKKESFDRCIDYDIDNTKSKYLIWCISRNGPFKSFMKKIGIVDNDWCRYCHCVPETPVHLINECFKINLIKDNQVNPENLADFLIKKLLKDKQLVN
jgi:hypothetical protein